MLPDLPALVQKHIAENLVTNAKNETSDLIDMLTLRSYDNEADIQEVKTMYWKYLTNKDTASLLATSHATNDAFANDLALEHENNQPRISHALRNYAKEALGQQTTDAVLPLQATQLKTPSQIIAAVEATTGTDLKNAVAKYQDGRQERTDNMRSTMESLGYYPGTFSYASYKYINGDDETSLKSAAKYECKRVE